MTNETQVMPLIERQLIQLEQQGIAIRTMFEGMKQIENNVNERFEEVKGMVQEVRDTVTLNDSECYQLQQAVFSKANEITKGRYKEMDLKFKAAVGIYRRLIWSHLKKKFCVARYPHIRRYEFLDALSFATNFILEDYL
jgi:uncharacterized protein YxjI